jgi:hypothetical protein
VERKEFFTTPLAVQYYAETFVVPGFLCGAN